MCVDHRNLTWTPMLLLLSGALCSQWKVEYHQKHICAVKGSSVLIPCSFYYPQNLTVKKVMWGHERHNIYEGPFLFDSEIINTSSKFQYIGNKHHNCSFKIHKVDLTNEGKYAFRFKIDEKNIWTGKVGSTLKVVDLNVSVTKTNVAGATKQGDSVNLTCINKCDDDAHLSSTFTWFKNGEPANDGRVLYLKDVSPANSGNYTCSLKTHAGTTSAVINIDVEYGPENTSVSARPAMEVDAGSTVTLTCSSRANPPVESYTWFKIDDDDVVGVGHQHVFITGDEGQYFCSASNKYGSQNSSVTTVMISEYWTMFNSDVLFILAMLLIVATVIALTRLHIKRTRAPDCKEDTQNSAHLSGPAVDNDRSQEGNQCEVIYTTVDFHTHRNSNTEQQIDSQCDDEGVIYSTVCR